MIKAYSKIALLIATVMVLLTSTAYADYLANFNLQIVNTDTGEGVVINSQDANLNESITQGWGSQYIMSTVQLGGVTGQITIAMSKQGPMNTVMTLMTNLTSDQNAANIQITLEDTGFDSPIAPATVAFSGILTNYDNSLNVGGDWSLAGVSAEFGTWLNTANSAPIFNPDKDGQQVDCANCSLASISIPVGDPSYRSPGIVQLPGEYGLISQSTIHFGPGGSQVQFALVNQVSIDTNTFTGLPVPEPSSLLLLGSGLVGLGAFRRKHRLTA